MMLLWLAALGALLAVASSETQAREAFKYVVRTDAV